MSRITSVMIFDNGNITVVDEEGKQVSDLQEPWLNFQGLRELARNIELDKPNIKAVGNLPPVVSKAFVDYLKFYRKHPDLAKEAPNE